MQECIIGVPTKGALWTPASLPPAEENKLLWQNKMKRLHREKEQEEIIIDFYIMLALKAEGV